MNEKVELPYFDVILESKENEKKLLEQSLNMHWGYWEDPSKAFTNEDQKFKCASDNLSRLIYNIVDIKEGDKVADVGCGFGGTIELMNQEFKNIEFSGLNIDPRQIAVARKRVKADNDNKIEFITGDACNLPFDDESIDALTAVECIFHFPDREKFISEVSRVLKPGGKFAYSDFVPVKESGKFRMILRELFKKIVGKHYGTSSNGLTINQYNEVAARNGLKNISALNINKNVMPTYTAIYYVMDHSDLNFKFFRKIPTRLLDLSQRFNQIHYMVIGYQKD